MVEALLFATEDSISVIELVRCMPYYCDPAKGLLQLSKRYVGRVLYLKIGKSLAISTASDLGFLMQRGKILKFVNYVTLQSRY